MKLKLFLFLSWILMVIVTWKAINTQGVNWPSISFGDILNYPWRAQREPNTLPYCEFWHTIK